MKLIPLTKGYFAKVDDEDYEYLMQWSWSAKTSKNINETYTIRGMRINGKVRTILMHREIMGLKFGDKKIVDHINGDGLDNRRSNLRLCTASENRKNMRKSAGKYYSKYLGVTFRKKEGRWAAMSTWMGKSINLGSFETEEEAALAYNEMTLKQTKEFSKLNIIT